MPAVVERRTLPCVIPSHNLFAPYILSLYAAFPKQWKENDRRISGFPVFHLFFLPFLSKKKPCKMGRQWINNNNLKTTHQRQPTGFVLWIYWYLRLAVLLVSFNNVFSLLFFPYIRESSTHVLIELTSILSLFLSLFRYALHLCRKVSIGERPLERKQKSGKTKQKLPTSLK